MKKQEKFDVTCVCTNKFKVMHTWSEDNWNVGHYGCTTPEIVNERYEGRCDVCGFNYEEIKDIRDKLKRKKESEVVTKTFVVKATRAKIKEFKETMDYLDIKYEESKRGFNE